MRNDSLPLAPPDIDDAELTQIKESLASDWIATGPKGQRFERDIVVYISAPAGQGT
jgi:dTDP-4-amino-4,6-dideoxygalactose transaminase